MNRLKVAIFLTLNLGLLGCPKRVEFGAEGPITEPQVLLDRMRASEAQLVSVEGDATLKVDAEEGKGTVQLFVSVARPALVHIEAMDFFGKPQGVLVSDGTRFGFYDGKRARYYRGPATPANLARFLPVALAPGELVGLLLGAPPRVQPEQAAVSWEAKEGLYRLRIERAPVSQTLWVDPSDFRVRRSELRGSQSSDTRFDAYRRVDAAWLPFKLGVQASEPRAELELRYTQVKANGPLDLTLFEPVPPQGVEVVDVDASGRPLSPVGGP